MTGEREQGTPADVAAAVLGTLDVRLSGAPVPLGHARQKAVLAVLLFDVNRVVPAEGLIDRVWGGHPPARARSVLRTYVSNLRRALARTGITITWRDHGYALTADPDSVDLHRFRRLLAEARGSGEPRRALELADEALALWRGEPLAELDTPWARSVRDSLRQERTAAQADRTDWALDRGRHADVLPELTARTAEDPLDERLAGQVMLALYRSGRQADALEHYQRTRRRLAEELGTDPCPALQRLHQRILTADPALTAAVRFPGETGSASVPRQLPAAPTPFIGREGELARLDAASDAQTLVIFAIGGAGGIGKTWLALHWAHRRLDRFPDGQLFADLRGFSPDSEPMNPAVAVRGFLDALGVADNRIPVDPHAQAALFRSLVADRRMLIMLDNAADTSQLTPLLPGSRTCTVLVTSRSRLSGLVIGHGARQLSLDVLTEAEARALLVNRVGADRVHAEPEAVDEIIRLCGGFPLALSIVAAHAQTHPHTSLTAAAAELRGLGLDALDDDDPAASLPTVLSWSRRALTTEQWTVFALLGIAPGPDISLAAAAALAGLSARRTRTALRALRDAFLIEEHLPGRYTMHDLVRAYAASTAHDLPEPVRQAALARVVDFYLHTCYAAERLLSPHRQPIDLAPIAANAQPHPLPDHPAALAWLQREHPHLLAAQHTALAHHRYPVVWQLAWALTSFHGRRGHHHDALAVWRAALEAANHLPDLVNHVVAHRRLGFAHAWVGEAEEATWHLRQALVLAEHQQDSVQQAAVHRDLAWAWARRGENRRALEHAQRALDVYRALDNPVWEADALNAVGWCAARLGEYDTARAHCQAALRLHRRHHDHNGEAHTLDSLGYIDHHTGRHAQAVDHYQQALAQHRASGHTYEVADTLDRLGHAHAALGQHDPARAGWREALELYREQQRDEDAARVRRQLDDLDARD
ncbi:AfsR/SARP family transcriptional regulator [Goodfellowiella coeruleoviolacea]|uniref:DNA-binding transcriptional activator of the SARP family n=1 Tax=Goodfellowiella coeruleoviolacea TaxID=334858 RepID=A0AAE3KDW8_9PSEU|nr:BTAD domain-containing putative transcriptional regulator [Goodfellowiella coeruleoviolacea]MCP2163237.1 DNA-binding transcriptional activator of the SARP family [Goodfellowiella coeruleoviolacea]